MFGMNIKDPLFPSHLKPSNDSNSSSPSPHLWSVAQFLYISVALSAATFVLPVIGGPVFRSTLRSFNRYRVYWRVAVLVFVLSATIVLDVDIPPFPFEMVFAIPQTLFTFYELWRASERNRPKRRWAGHATILGVCIAIDF